MADRRRERDGPEGERGTRPGDPAAELEAALDELEVRFLLDPETTFETSIDPERGAEQ
jgi:hypothetical protein